MIEFDAKSHVMCGEILEYQRESDGYIYYRVMLKTTRERVHHSTLGLCTLIGYRADDDSDPSDAPPIGDNVAVIPDTMPSNNGYWKNKMYYLTKNPSKKFFFVYPEQLRLLS